MLLLLFARCSARAFFFLPVVVFFCSFQFIREGQTYSVADAMAKFTGTFHTGEIKGTGRPKEFELPYRGRTLRGQEIVDLANDWAARGVLEVSQG